MKLHLWSYRILAMAIPALISCNEHLKTEANDLPQGYADSQVVGNWKITAEQCNVPYDWDGNGSLETDVYSTWTPCEKDNTYTFSAMTTDADGNKPGTFKLDCSVTKNGTWKILDTKILMITPDGLTSEYGKFISMTAVEFKTTRDISLPNGLPATLTQTWTRQ